MSTASAPSTAGEKDLREFIAHHLRHRSASWSIGVSGALAEFQHTPEESYRTRFSVISELGGMEIGDPLPHDVASHQCDRPNKELTRVQREVVFSVPERAAHAFELRELGDDQGALSRECRNHRLFDLGLTGNVTQACVRTDDVALINQLREHVGHYLLDAPDSVFANLIAKSPNRVFLSPLGRIEVYQPIPAQRTPTGPHTHILPDYLGRSNGNAHALPPNHVAIGTLHLPSDTVSAHPLVAPCEPYQGAKRCVDHALQSRLNPDQYRALNSRSDGIAIATSVIEYEQRFGRDEITSIWRERAKSLLS